MDNIKTSVPFDPGYSKISFSLMANLGMLTNDYNNLKTMHQKKFKLSQLEPKIIDMINKSTAFYLGCQLWGGFLHSRYKNDVREISGNHTLKLSDAEKKELDCAEETKFTLAYIEQFNRDCKYYLNKPAKISDLIIEILNSYNEFAQINKNFTNVKKTSDIKLPKVLAHFDKLSNEQLDKLHDKINAVIDSGKVEGLLEIGFYKV